MVKRDNEGAQERYEAWKRQLEAEHVSPKDKFRQASAVAVLMAYDLIDKLRFWEQQTLELPDDEVVRHLEHTARFIEQFREAYDTFADVDF